MYEASFSPICPTLYQPLFLNNTVPEGHKSGIDMGRNLLRRSHVSVVCGSISTESMKNDVDYSNYIGRHPDRNMSVSRSVWTICIMKFEKI